MRVVTNVNRCRKFQYQKFAVIMFFSLLFCGMPFLFEWRPGLASSNASLLVTPHDAQGLQDAIDQVADGGTIELSTGTYAAPAGGFRMNNLGKSFTVRAVGGGEVILDGGNTTDILRFQNTAREAGKLVVFENLIFANGRSVEEGVAGGVTIHYAEAIFRYCIFRNNAGQQATTGGGGMAVGLNSSVEFYNSTWLDNTAQNEGGGLAVNANSIVKIYSSEFRNNRVNLPNHRVNAAGGGIHVGNAQLYVDNTLFEGNSAGYVGGAVFIIGNWTDSPDTPAAYANITNSTFRNNVIARDPSVSFPLPTEGGAFHAEDQSTAEISNSLFEGNSADNGGAINLYRSIIKVDGSIFRDNLAVGSGAATGFGAAISAVSNDTNDATTNFGAVNRRPSQLTVNNSVFTRNSAAPSQIANGVYLAGDSYRTYGLGGVAQNGSAADNRAVATITHSVFHNMDVQEASGVFGTGVGGAITTDLADLTLQDVLISGADAVGEFSSGGALALLDDSLARMNDLTVSSSSSEKFGGAIFIQGSTIELNGCSFIANEISPGVTEANAFSSFGAAIFAGVDEGRNLSARGYVANCLFTDNIGLPIFDDDRNGTAVNAIQYNANQFYTTYFDGVVYLDGLVGAKNVNELNTLVIDRPTEDTQKSTNPNSILSESPSTGLLMSTRTSTLLTDNDPYYLAYAWSGKSATLDGETLSRHSDLKLCSIATCQSSFGPASHSLQVDSQDYSVTIPSMSAFSEKVYLPVLTR